MKVFSGALSDYWRRRKSLAVIGYGLGDWNLRVMLKNLRVTLSRPGAEQKEGGNRYASSSTKSGLFAVTKWNADNLRKTADQSDIVQDHRYVEMLHAVQPVATTLMERVDGPRGLDDSRSH